EPPRPPTPEPTVSTYTRDDDQIRDKDSWREIKIRLVGSHPLWAHHLWNAALALASYLDAHQELYHDHCVLELGAGGALPSIVTAKNGAQKVVVTDYPDASLADNMTYNIAENVGDESPRVDVQGYIWGRPVGPLLDVLPSSKKFQLVILSDLIFNHSQGYIWGRPVGPLLDVLPSSKKFQLVILSDLIFNHSQHDALLKTCELVLAPVNPDAPEETEPCVLVFYSHHRPHLAHRDMEFFTNAEERGWVCKEIVTRTFPPMFPEDSGEESVRSTVHGWRLTRQK
ncbi:hypothetical protein CVT25_004399, partial [Psilocybe cyanescens]